MRFLSLLRCDGRLKFYGNFVYLLWAFFVFFGYFLHPTSYNLLPHPLMYRENIAVKSINFIFKDIIFDVLFWPIWWYSIGLAKSFNNMKETVAQGNRELALGIWVKNLFVPMFGQTDWQGRLISFFMRLVQIIIRFVAFLFWIAFAVIVFMFWPLLPVFIVFQILLNFGLFGKLW